MKFLILIIFLIGCGQESSIEPTKKNEPIIIENFQLPPIACDVNVPGVPPMVIVVPWSEAYELEESSEFIDCRFPGEE